MADNDEMLFGGYDVDTYSLATLPAPQATVSSPTPMNHSTNSTINPQQTLWHKGLDDDSLYSITDDMAHKEQLFKGKRKRPIAPKERAVSFTPIWEFQDEEYLNIMNSVDDCAPKRNRAGPNKRAQSMKTQTVTPPQAWNVDEELSQHNRSFLTTVPIKKTKDGPTASKRNVNPNPLFKNPVITKPRAKSLTKDIEHEEAPVEMVKYQGFTTTQESVQLPSGILAPTTLENLAKFRYKPSSLQVQDVDRRSSRRPMHDLEVPFKSIFDAVVKSADGSGSPVRHDQLHGSAKRHEKHDIEPISSPWKQWRPNMAASADNHGDAAVFPIGSHDEKPTGASVGVDNIGSKSQALSAMEFDQCNYSDVWNADEPISWDVRPTDHTLGKFIDTHTGRPSFQHNPEPSVGLAVEDRPASQDGQVVSPGRSMSDDRDTSGIEIWQSRRVDNSTIVNPRAAVDIERTDIDETYQGIALLPDLYAGDEFDEGLDDADLLALHSEPLVPETPPKFRAAQAPISVSSLSQFPANPVVQVANSLAKSGENAIASAQNEQSGLEDLFSEAGDDFPMDETEEKEILQLAAMRNAANVIDMFEPPSSVQRAYDDDGEVYDGSLQYSPPKQYRYPGEFTNNRSTTQTPVKDADPGPPASREEDWSFIPDRNPPQHNDKSHRIVVELSDSESDKADIRRPPGNTALSAPPLARQSQSQSAHASVTNNALTDNSQANYTSHILDDSHEYQPLDPFIRPPFPSLVMDRCPINGLCAQSFLRTCFRIGEMYQAGSKCAAQKLDAIIELFARVNFSSREPGTSKQHFQFMDLWHDRAPYPNGILSSYRTSGLAESESRIFLSRDDKKMARVLGRLKRDIKNASWVLHIINIRPTDWEEIRWTKRIITGDNLAAQVDIAGPLLT